LDERNNCLLLKSEPGKPFAFPRGCLEPTSIVFPRCRETVNPLKKKAKHTAESEGKYPGISSIPGMPFGWILKKGEHYDMP
jgi:hypothetical protein